LIKTPQIAVVGAGIAGLSCAESLQRAGFLVRVFDKSRGPSGRMSTRRGDGWQCDHGAQYFTARDPAFVTEVRRWQRAGVAGVWTPRLTVFGQNPLQQEPEPALNRFVGVPHMTAPARYLADTLQITFGAAIVQIERQYEGWYLKTEEQGWLDNRFDAVLLALPAPQAVLLLQPVSPGLTATATSARMRASWALILHFAGPVDLPFDAAFVNEGPLRWIARDNSKPGRPDSETWLLHARHDWSQVNLEASPETVADVLLQAFGDLGGPLPRSWTAHRWRYADTEAALTHGCVLDPDLGLGICGDWLNGGRVEGAWLSGQALARQVMQSLFL